MLRIASRLPAAADRKQWALWADRNAVAQMTFEVEGNAWTPQIALARGRSSIVAANASLQLLSARVLADGAAGALDVEEIADCTDRLKNGTTHPLPSSTCVAHHVFKPYDT